MDALVAERVWQEFERALGEGHPERFFVVLKEAHALAVLFPQIEKHFFTIKALRRAAEYKFEPEMRFAAMFYQTAPDDLITLAERYRVPSDYRDLALLAARYVQPV